MEQESHAQILRKAAHEIGIDLTERQVDQFMMYLNEILRWNEITNLTSITDPIEIIVKHFVDSLTVLATQVFEIESCICDVGSGAGLPGIPIKIARPDLKVILVEPNKKKSSFLQSVIGILHLNDVTVYSGSFDRYVHDFTNKKIDALMLRALRFGEIAKDVCRLDPPMGTVVLFRTKHCEISDLPSGFTLVGEQELSLPLGLGKRVISVLKPIHVPRGTWMHGS